MREVLQRTGQPATCRETGTEEWVSLLQMPVGQCSGHAWPQGSLPLSNRSPHYVRAWALAVTVCRSHYFPEWVWLCSLRTGIFFHGQRPVLFQSSIHIPSNPPAVPPCHYCSLQHRSSLLLSGLWWSALPPHASVPFSLIKPSPPSLHWTKAHNTCSKTTPKGSEWLKGLCQGNCESENKTPAEFVSWVQIPKRALDSYIPIFCRNTRHNLKAHIYFWKKGKIRLTMKAGWKIIYKAEA